MRIPARTIEVAGHRAYYTEAGAGPTVLLLSSMFVLSRSYGPTVDELVARRFRVITLEMPGSGRASRLGTPWSFPDYADWLRRFLEAMELTDTTVVGHSNSGPVALLAATHGDPRIARIVLADLVGAKPRSTLDLLLCRSIDAFLEPLLSIGGWPHIAYNVVHHTRNAFHQLVLSGQDMRSPAPRVSVPVLLAWGSRDHTTPPSGADEFSRLLPDACTHLSARGSHDWLITHASEFADAVAVFVRSSCASPDRPAHQHDRPRDYLTHVA